MKTKTKTVPVKNLHEAIKAGMTYKEAAKHALLALTRALNCVSEDVDVDMEWFLKDLIECMVESEDHSLKFIVEEDRGDEILSWDVTLGENWDLDSITYFSFNMDHAQCNADEDAATLNQFILDFYGIKKHSEPKMTTKKIRAELRRVKAEISEKKSELKNLTSQMNRLSKMLDFKRRVS